jgi:hypothetical protein
VLRRSGGDARERDQRRARGGAIMACASVGPIGPCSMSMRMKSSPERASTCTTCTERMVAMAPSAQRASAHIARRRFRPGRWSCCGGCSIDFSPALRA